LRELLQTTASAEEFDARVALEFDIYKSAGWNGKGGGVLFTGYCTPILDGALAADATYAYPLYGLPDDLVKGKKGEILGQKQAGGALAPYPTRAAIEAGGLLKDRQLELVWLRDPLDAFIAHVNGSAVIRLPDGSERRFGYAGKNGREYSSLGKLLVADRHIPAGDISLHEIRAWGAKNPELLKQYIARDDSFVFFLPIEGAPKGSLNVDVEPGRTLATDKELFPRGGVVFIDVEAPSKASSAFVYDRLMLDQDTGGAIRTAGRADIYIGIGDDAEHIAGATKYPGQMYYFFAKDSVTP
jgi:membrane-bound lytic murein transglycosylase A